MNNLIALSVGFLDKMASTRTFDPNVTYPVYILEPLVVLALRSLFEKQGWTTMVRSFRIAPNKLSLGFVFEGGPLLMLMEIFGESSVLSRPSTVLVASH
jgi:hypothetical protein